MAYVDGPPNPNRTSAFVSVLVADIGTVHKEWSHMRAEFGAEPKHRSGGDR